MRHRPELENPCPTCGAVKGRRCIMQPTGHRTSTSHVARKQLLLKGEWWRGE